MIPPRRAAGSNVAHTLQTHVSFTMKACHTAQCLCVTGIFASQQTQRATGTTTSRNSSSSVKSSPRSSMNGLAFSFVESSTTSNEFSRTESIKTAAIMPPVTFRRTRNLVPIRTVSRAIRALQATTIPTIDQAKHEHAPAMNLTVDFTGHTRDIRRRQRLPFIRHVTVPPSSIGICAHRLFVDRNKRHKTRSTQQPGQQTTGQEREQDNTTGELKAIANRAQYSRSSYWYNQPDEPGRLASGFSCAEQPGLDIQTTSTPPQRFTAGKFRKCSFKVVA